MTILRLILMSIIASLLMAIPAAAEAEDLVKLSLHSVSSISPKVDIDTKVKIEGEGSLKITTRWPTSVSIGEVIGPNVENAKLVYSAKVKTELEEAGTVFLEMWAHVKGGQYFSKGLNDAAGPRSDWKTIQTPFMFQKGQKPDKVTLNIVINGKGTVWVDDVVLSKVALE